MERVMALIKKADFLRKIGAGIIIKVAGVAVSYLFTYLVTRYYGVETWGLLTLSLSVLSFCVLFSKFGFDTAFLRYVSSFLSNNQPHAINKVYKKGITISIVIAFLLSGLMYVSADFIAVNIFSKADLAKYLQLGSMVIIPHTLYLINAEGLRGYDKVYDFIAINNLFLYLLSSISVLYIFYFMPHYLHVMYIPILIYVFATFLVWIYSQIRISSLITYEKSDYITTYKAIITISLPMFLSNAMFVLMDWTDTLVLGVFTEEASVGVYNILLKISNLMIFPLSSIAGFMGPQIAKAYAANDKEELSGILHKSAKYSFYLSAILLFPLLIVSYPLLVFMGEGFDIALYCLFILIFGQFFNAWSGPNDTTLLMTGNEKVFRNIVMVSMLMNVSLNCLFIPYWGIYGAAIATFISKMFWNIASLYIIKKRLGVGVLYVPWIK